MNFDLPPLLLKKIQYTNAKFPVMHDDDDDDDDDDDAQKFIKL